MGVVRVVFGGGSDGNDGYGEGLVMSVAMEVIRVVMVVM